MFIFDAGTMKKNVKGMRLFRCSNCRKETPHDLTEIGFYVTALEVPLAPYKKKYVLICRQCTLGEELSKEEFHQLMLHTEGKGYLRPSERESQKRRTARSFCRHCGAEIRTQARFCNECGRPIL